MRDYLVIDGRYVLIETSLEGPVETEVERAYSIGWLDLEMEPFGFIRPLEEDIPHAKIRLLR